ncbi:SDR family oxidoreductase [Aureimonas fodinaquatilis]|uniref:SDR family oxidoreductase n=1 Tax=Aureimonas fodinaquatilis TaxID=2565783 RepID=A0A5B0DUB5_9HYPH|nr:SDR family oxidoreductase [Aureimonas fodinaquatilis]KAA0970407.1 SDR family oxidoreductase [Aureimonas fodinaquatilis]
MSAAGQAGILAGKVALVTGAGKGIGRACALALANAGARVIAVARTAEDLTSLEQAAPGQVESWVEDVRGDALPNRIKALKQLDILVNNAGTNKLQYVLDVDDETLDLLIALNIRAAFKVAQAAGTVMAAQETGGSIVNISSQMGHVGGPRRTVYAMTKHAIEGMTKAMAIDLAPHKVRVNAVAPTVVVTPMTAPFFNDPAYMEAAMASIPLKEVLQPEDVAGAVLYLASPAARLVTGTSLRVDGGATAV